jgi:hypothetical protein
MRVDILIGSGGNGVFCVNSGNPLVFGVIVNEIRFPAFVPVKNWFNIDIDFLWIFFMFFFD